MKRVSKQHLRQQFLLLFCALAGAGIAIYLTFIHYQAVPLVCSTSGIVDCARVLTSPYSVLPSTAIPISLPGIGWCAVMAVLAFVGMRQQVRSQRLDIAQCIWALSGTVTVFYLVYVEIVRIRYICMWCTFLHVIIIIIFIVTFIRLPSMSSEPEDKLVG